MLAMLASLQHQMFGCCLATMCVWNFIFEERWVETFNLFPL